MKAASIVLIVLPAIIVSAQADLPKLPYTVVDTAQIRCYNDRTEIPYPKSGKPYFG